MFKHFFTKIFGTKVERTFKEFHPYVKKINEEYERLQGISDDELRASIQPIQAYLHRMLKNMDQRMAALQQKINNNTSPDAEQVEKKEDLVIASKRFQGYYNQDLHNALSQVLPQAFALIKETARRFKEKKQLIVTATDFDRALAANHNYVVIQNDQAIWHNQWDVMGHPITWDMVHYDVQLIGGVVLHQGKIAEMATGEGKTLAATLPAFLNALSGKGVQIITVNDYLAKRDAAWMGPLYEFHGLKVDCIDKYHPHSKARKAAYQADIIYGTNSEFGFDYLRDNMVNSQEDVVQRERYFAIIDEVDSVLIDDARTPLIISGPTEKEGNEAEYLRLKPQIEQLYNAQKHLVTQLLQDAKNKIKEGNKKEGSLSLFRAYRGLPKYRPLITYLSEPGIKQLLEKIENYYLQDNASLMPEADEPLLFTIDEQQNRVDVTEKGLHYITEAENNPTFFVLPDIGIEMAQIENDPRLKQYEKEIQKATLQQDYSTKAQRIHITHQLLKAYTLFEEGIDYIIVDKKVKIINEQTGRVLEGRRYSDGLHQAIEAKENVKIEKPSQTYATITLQNYFRMYHKLAGMTGTAETDEAEFVHTYRLEVKVIPTDQRIIREDKDDKIYKTAREKFNAILEEIVQLSQQGRPVLVGTASVEISELVSKMLTMKKIKHQILNAKHHQKEAKIIAEAGKAGTVTIATNMAGRGTDIKLSPEAKAAGGLAIIGTEHHESRRIDRQLRGRAGRQGDPGSSQFFVSLEDDLMRLFGSGRIAAIMDRLGLEEGEVIQHPMVTKSIEKAQAKVEQNNFGIRRRLLEYDDVMNTQRSVIYYRRQEALSGQYLDVEIRGILHNILEHRFIYEEIGGYEEAVERFLHTHFGVKNFEHYADFRKQDTKQQLTIIYQYLLKIYNKQCKQHQYDVNALLYALNKKENAIPENIVIYFSDEKTNISVVVNYQDYILSNGEVLKNNFEKLTILTFIDQHWKEYLREMDELKQAVQNAVYEQKDPLLIYKAEAYGLFKSLVQQVNQSILSYLFQAKVYTQFAHDILPSTTETKHTLLRETRHEVQRVSSSNDILKHEKRAIVPAKPHKIARRNQRVTVRYPDGSIKENVKFKTIEEDLANDRCLLIEEQ